MANEDKTLNQTGASSKAPNPGTKDAIKAELEQANAKLAAAEAELEALKKANATQEPKAAAETAVEEGRVKLFIPRGASNDEPNLLISVNGVNYLLPKGKESTVPAHIAAEYYRSVAARERLERNRSKLLGTAQQ